jgi:uncharacterized protein HemY
VNKTIIYEAINNSLPTTIITGDKKLTNKERLEWLDKALVFEPANSETLNLMGNVHFEEKRWTKATKLFEQACENDGENTRACSSAIHLRQKLASESK